MSPATLWLLYYTDEVLSKLVTFTNDNVALRKQREPEKNKGEWKQLTVKDLKVFYGLVIMKDIIKLDRDIHYWNTDPAYPLLRTSFGDVMSRNRFFQIRRYLYFVFSITIDFFLVLLW